MERTKEVQQKIVLTVADLMLLTGWTRKTIYNKVSLRQIPHYKPNGCKTVFFKTDEIMDYLLSNRQATEAELEQMANNYNAKR